MRKLALHCVRPSDHLAFDSLEMAKVTRAIRSAALKTSPYCIEQLALDWRGSRVTAVSQAWSGVVSGLAHQFFELTAEACVTAIHAID
jgi:hypothetical protein